MENIPLLDLYVHVPFAERLEDLYKLEGWVGLETKLERYSLENYILKQLYVVIVMYLYTFEMCSLKFMIHAFD